MTAQPLEQSFHGPGITAELTSWEDRCHLEILIDSQIHKLAETALLEVMFQASNQRGLANCAPVLLYESRWPLSASLSNQFLTSSGWLPRSLKPQLARRCHFRVTPIILGASHK